MKAQRESSVRADGIEKEENAKIKCPLVDADIRFINVRSFWVSLSPTLINLNKIPLDASECSRRKR